MLKNLSFVAVLFLSSLFWCDYRSMPRQSWLEWQMQRPLSNWCMWPQRRLLKASCLCLVWRKPTTQTCWVVLPWMRCTAAASGDMTSDQVRASLTRLKVFTQVELLSGMNKLILKDLGLICCIFLYCYVDYKLLGILKRQFPKVPLLGLTATATSSVLKDCEKILCVQQPITLTASFNRTNLYYEVSMDTTHMHTFSHLLHTHNRLNVFLSNHLLNAEDSLLSISLCNIKRTLLVFALFRPLLQTACSFDWQHISELY